MIIHFQDHLLLIIIVFLLVFLISIVIIIGDSSSSDDDDIYDDISIIDNNNQPLDYNNHIDMHSISDEDIIAYINSMNEKETDKIPLLSQYNSIPLSNTRKNSSTGIMNVCIFNRFNI